MVEEKLQPIHESADQVIQNNFQEQKIETNFPIVQPQKPKITRIDKFNMKVKKDIKKIAKKTKISTKRLNILTKQKFSILVLTIRYEFLVHNQNRMGQGNEHCLS